MALQTNIPFPAPGSSVVATYHNISSITGGKAPDPINGPNNWAVEFSVASYANSTDRASGVPPLQTARWQCPVVAMDQPVLPQLYAFLETTAVFAGASSV